MNKRVKKYDDKYMKRFCTKYVWFSSLTGDLVFLAIVDTLFLTIVKGLSASQIILLNTIPSAIGIMVQPYILKRIHKIGNTVSIQLGALGFLIASLLITFGNQFIILILGKVFYQVALTFKNMENICLKNNLIYANREDEYVGIRNQSNIAYATITAVISIVSGFLFNLNAYLPMVLNCILCFGCFLLSLTMKDVTKYDKIAENEIQNAKVSSKSSMIVYVSMLSYAFFYTAVTIGQQNSKLLIQYELNDVFDVAITATYFSTIIMLSRFARIISNVLFDKIYRRLKDKINIALTSMLIVAFALIVLGSFVTENAILRIGIMAGGFFIILAVRDPFKVYIQDLILKVTEPEQQQAIFANLELAKKIGETLMGFVVSAALLKISIIWIIAGACVMSIMTLKTTMRLLELVRRMEKFGANQKQSMV